MSWNINHCCKPTPQTALVHAPTDQDKQARDSLTKSSSGENDCVVAQASREGPCGWRVVLRFTSLCHRSTFPLALAKNTASHWCFVARGEIWRRNPPDAWWFLFSSARLVLHGQCELTLHQQTAHDHSGYYHSNFHCYKYPSPYYVQKLTVYKEHWDNVSDLGWPPSPSD